MKRGSFVCYSPVKKRKWCDRGNPVFANILKSEQDHMDAMESLLAFYGMVDSVTSDGAGMFANRDMAAPNAFRSALFSEDGR
jgi:hypothetical protein